MPPRDAIRSFPDVSPDDNTLGMSMGNWQGALVILACVFGPLAPMLLPVFLIDGHRRLHARAEFSLGYLLVIVSSLVAICGVLGGLTLYRAASRFVARVPVGRARERPDGTLLFVEGRVAPDAATVASPHEGKPCVMGELRVEQRAKNSRLGPEVDARPVGVPFTLEDGETSIDVDPAGALLRGAATDLTTGPERAKLEARLEAEGRLREPKAYDLQAKERYVVPGQRITVLGVLERSGGAGDGYRDGAARVRLIGTPGARMLVTSESHAELRRAVSGRRVLVVGLVACAVLALGYALVFDGSSR